MHGATDVGCVRKENQDSFLCYEPEDEEELARKGRLVMVADGMGGLASGGDASRTAVDVIRRLYYSYRSGPRVSLETATIEANAAIFAQAATSGSGKPMGSTVTAMTILDRRAVVAQVGDSRAYMLTGGRLEQVTRDHSLVRELLDRGEIDADSPQYSFQRNILTRGLGLREDVEVDLLEIVGLRHGDIFLLSSDGLHEQVSSAQIQEVLENHDDLESACSQLIELARAAGGPDNITTVLVRVEVPSDVDAALDGVQRPPSDARESAGLLPVATLVSFAAGACVALWLAWPSMRLNASLPNAHREVARNLSAVAAPEIDDEERSRRVEGLRNVLIKLGLLPPQGETSSPDHGRK